MRDRTVAGNDQINAFHNGGDVHDRLRLVAKAISQIEDGEFSSDARHLLGTRSHLEADEIDSIDFGQGGETRQRKGTQAVAAKMRVALPSDSNAEVLSAVAPGRSKHVPPLGDLSIIGLQIRNVGRDGIKAGVKNTGDA